MSNGVTHINLIERTAPEHLLGWSALGIFAATLLGLGYASTQSWALYRQANDRMGEVTQQIKQAQEQLDTRRGAEAKNAKALALRREVDNLAPQAIVASALLDAAGVSISRGSDGFAKTVATSISQSEPGLWLTGLTLAEGGTKLDLVGQSGSAAAVLRYAQRTNEALKPLDLRLDNLELQPLSGGTGAGAGVLFRLY